TVQEERDYDETTLTT
nr:immunoglobulin heavy chain junction region [Mus musculus]MBK4187388.1 immunoglobulin heavy chain junction region [Mus musculus]